MPHKETSELRRFLALLIVLLSTIAVVVSLTRHDPPPKTAGVVLMASQRPHLMPDDTNPPTTTTTAPPPQAAALVVRWPAAPRHTRSCGRSLDQIKHDESGGSYTEVNPSSGAGGAYQFLPSTWRSNGGQGLPQNASPAEQDRIAQKVYAEQGTAPWRASGC